MGPGQQPKPLRPKSLSPTLPNQAVFSTLASSISAAMGLHWKRSTLLFSSLTKAPGLLTPSVAGLGWSSFLGGCPWLHPSSPTVRRLNDRAGNLPLKIRDWLAARCTKALESLAEDKHSPPRRALPKAPDVAVDRHSANQVGTSRYPTRSAAEMYLGEVDGGGFLDEPQTFLPVLSKRCLVSPLQEMSRQVRGKMSLGDKGSCQSRFSGSTAWAGPDLGAQRASVCHSCSMWHILVLLITPTSQEDPW